MKKTQQVIIEKYGGADVLKWQDQVLEAPEANEVMISQQAIGINFIEIYYRNGLYPLNLPSSLGTEAAGIIESVGSEVTDFKIGDRVAYATGPLGSYTYHRNINTQFLVKIPNEISLINAAAILLKGLTAQYLVRQTYPVKTGDWVLLYAASGGVGLLTSQWANSLGANVIGIVGSSEKAKLAKESGCKHVIVGYEDIPKEVRDITGGRGVDVVYDSVGKDTFMGSLDCLCPRGMMVSFGNTSGAVGPISLNMLAQKGSLYVTRPTLYGYAAKHEDLINMSNELFKMIISGSLLVKNVGTMPFASVADAHNLISDRKTTGATVLVRDGASLV